MDGERTTMIVQRYLEHIACDERTETLVRDLLDRSARRLHGLCDNMLRRSYPRLARPPLGMQSEELLSAVVERLMKAMRAVKPAGVRQFFALASQHMRWELNDVARRLDELPREHPLGEIEPAAAPSSTSGLSVDSQRMLRAIDELPEDEREAFSLVRIQGLSHPEAAEILQVSTKTVQRHLHGAMVILSTRLHDLRP